MSRVKEQEIERIDSLPEDSTLEDIQHHRYVCQKIEHGLKAVEGGRVVSQEEAEKRAAEWVKSAGPKQR
jgi:hypothetical protein